MYLIIRHGFDYLENHNPHYTTIVGYVEGELDADIWIQKQDEEQSKGWDGKMYPYYTKHKIEELY